MKEIAKMEHLITSKGHVTDNETIRRSSSNSFTVVDHIIHSNWLSSVISDGDNMTRSN